MILKLDLSKSAGDFLLELPSKQCKQVVATVLRLTRNPRPHDSSKLQGFDDLYRADIGEYRVVYSFDDKIVFVKLIGKRNDDEIYKKLKR
jgi:mRNA interferase RelE/StbE